MDLDPSTLAVMNLLRTTTVALPLATITGIELKASGFIVHAGAEHRVPLKGRSSKWVRQLVEQIRWCVSQAADRFENFGDLHGTPAGP